MSSFQEQQRKRKKWRLISILICGIVLAIGICIWILSYGGILSKSLSSIPNTIFGGIIAFVALMLTVLTKLQDLLTKLQDLFTKLQNLLPKHWPRPHTKAPQLKFNDISVLPLPIRFTPILTRQDEIENVYQELIEPDVTALVIVGGDGTGKSTLASLICRYAKEHPHNLFGEEPLWLSINENVTIIDLAGTIFGEEILPGFSELSPRGQARELNKLLNAKKQSRLIVLDRFDQFFYGQKEKEQDPKKQQAINEWLELLNREEVACRMLITSHSSLPIVAPSPQGRIREHKVEKLSEQEGIVLLRSLGIEEDEAELGKAVERCEGHASALIYLARVVKKEDSKLTNYLNDPAHVNLWLGNVVNNWLDYLYNNVLTDTQRDLLQGFSIYRESVPLETARTSTSNTQSGYDLYALIDHQLLIATNGLFRPTAIVRAYVRKQFEGIDEIKTLQKLHRDAAQYYEKEYKNASTNQKSINQIHLLAEAVWHYCEAEQWPNAYDLMEQNGFFADFRSPSHAIGLLEAYQLLLPSEKWQPSPLCKAHIFYSIAVIYADLGKKEWARKYYEEVLSIWNDKEERKQKAIRSDNLDLMHRVFRQMNDEGRKWKGVTLSNLGRVYSALGKKKEALDKYTEALRILRDTGERLWIGTTLSYQGRAYGSLEQYDKAKEAYEKALGILRKEDDRSIEGITLSYLGVIYCHLGQKEKGLNYCNEGLEQAHLSGDKRALGRVTINLGRLYSMQGNCEKANYYYVNALKFTEETKDRNGEGVVFQNMGDLCNMQGQKDQAKEHYKEALAILTEVDDHWRESMVYNDLGNIYVEEGQWKLAAEHYNKALETRRSIGDQKGVASTMYGIAKLFLQQNS